MLQGLCGENKLQEIFLPEASSELSSVGKNALLADIPGFFSSLFVGNHS